MLLAAVNALAGPVKLLESSGRFDLELELPEGAILNQEFAHDGLSLINVTFADPALPLYKVTVAYGEEAGDKTMSDWVVEVPSCVCVLEVV